MSSKVRVQWVDIVKFICIMCVMHSHLETCTDAIYLFYNNFFLNGFFFASGYVYFHRDGFGTFLKKKIKGLLIPWLFFSVLNILLSHILSLNNHASVLEELKWNFLQIRGRGDGIWFVAALFVTFLPFYFCIDLYEKSAKRLVDSLLLVLGSFTLSVLSNVYTLCLNPNILPWGSSALPWHLEYIFKAMFWMVMGYLFNAKLERKFDSIMKIYVKVLSLFFYLIIVYLQFCITSGFSLVENIIYIHLAGLIGIFVLVWVCKSIKPNRYLLYIGQNTLLCFALHGKVYSVIQTVSKRYATNIYSLILNNAAYSFCYSIVITVIISVVLIVPIYIINRWFPFLVGRKSKLK